MGSSRSRSKCPAMNEDRLTMRGTYRFVIAFPGSGKRRRDKLLVHVCWGIVHTRIYSYFWSICIFIFESQLTGLELQSYPKFIVVALSRPSLGAAWGYAARATADTARLVLKAIDTSFVVSTDSCPTSSVSQAARRDLSKILVRKQ